MKKTIIITGALLLLCVTVVAVGGTSVIESYFLNSSSVTPNVSYAEKDFLDEQSFLVIDESYRIGDSLYVKGHLQGNSRLVSVKVNNIEARLSDNFFSLKRDASFSNDSKLKVIASLDNGQVIVSMLRVDIGDSVSETFVEKIFVAGTQTSLSLGSASLYVDSGLIKNDTALSISKLTKKDLPPLPFDMVNVTVEEGGYRFLPHGMMFEGEAFVSLPYDSTLIPSGYSIKDIRTFFYDEKKEKWVALPLACVNSEARTIESRTTHFTDMINALLKTPDNPEGNIFVPTQMQGLNATNPISGITMMEAPHANARGSLMLQYPINVPVGRQGMTPNVVLAYNSSIKGGWAGEGWDFHISKITIDTRWGVPLYLPDQESESYMIDGERMTPNARKKPLDARASGDKRFYLERESTFAKIIRHGNSPTDYTWEIVDKNGKKSIYTVVQSSITSGIRSEWYLTREIDVHGNTVNYNYDIVDGEMESKEIVLSSIDYTGFEGEKGVYSVVFHYDKGRTDASLNARYGYMCQTNGTLLKNIEVKYKDEILRKYNLEHSDGAFFKKILTSIKELDSEGELIGEHKMSYDNNVGVGDNLTLWKRTTERTISDKNVNPKFVSNVNDHGFNDSYSSLSGSYAKSITVGGALGAGVCVTVGPAKCSAVLMGTYSHNQGSGVGSTTFIDIDGDGLSDRVVWDGEALYYEKNLAGMRFADPIELKGVGHSFSESKSWSNSWGLKLCANASAGVGANAGIGWERTKSTTKIVTYFADFNGDGLMDLNIDGTVYFNRLVNGIPTFSTNVYGVEVGAPVNPAYYPNPKDEEAELAEQFPLADVVRVWKAPFSGDIQLKVKVKSRSELKDSSRRDGVKVMVQISDEEVWREFIAKDDIEEHVFEIPVVSVARGTNIYFRQNSIYNGEQDYTSWNIEIDYLNADLKRKDLNGKTIGHFSNTEDFQLFGAKVFAKNGDGNISLSAPIEVDNQLDSVQVYALVKDKEGATVDTLFDEIFPPFVKTEKDLSVNSLNMKNGEAIEIFIESDGYVNYKEINFQPIVSEDEYQTYLNPSKKVKNLFRLGDSYEISRDSAVSVSFSTIYPQEFPDLNKESINNFLLYDNNNGVHKQRFAFADVESWDSLTFDSDTAFLSGSYTPTIHLSNCISLFKIDEFKCEVSNKIIHIKEIEKQITLENGVKKDTVVSDTTYTFEKDTVPMSIYADGWACEMGSLYRGWGQFQYNSNGGRAEKPLNQADLSFKQIDATKLENLGNGISDLETFNGLGFENPKDKILMPMTVDPEAKMYRGGDSHIFIGRDSSSSGRIGLQDIYVSPYVREQQNGVFDAPCKCVYGKSDAFIPEASVSVPFAENAFSAGVSVDASVCETKSSQNLEVMDMNGDRYPDIVTDNAIQYTDQWGARQTETKMSLFEVNETKASSNGGCMNVAVTYKNIGCDHSSDNANNTTQNNTTNASVGLSTSVSLSASCSKSKDSQKTVMLDINGDGLPDRVRQNGVVEYNIGYSFLPGVQIEYLQTTSNKSVTYGGNLGGGFNADNLGELSNVSVGGKLGVGLSSTTSNALRAYADLNGDGLVDLIDGDDTYLNIGGKFIKVRLLGFEYNDRGKTNAESANTGVNFSVCIPVYTVVGVEIAVDINASLQHSVSSSLYAVDDMDGDGYPDLLRSNDENEFTITQSITGTTNLLRRIETPFKKSMDFDYELRKPTQDDPYHYHLLKEVKTYDGHKGDGEDSTLVSFEYGKGKYDRILRENFGFESVTSKLHNADNSLHRVVTEKYDNTSYFTCGTLTSVETRLADGALVSKLQNEYAMLNPDNSNQKYTNEDVSLAKRVFFAKVATETKQYEIDTDTSIYLLSREDYTFDELGRVIEIKETGNSTNNRTAKVEYYTLEESFIVNNPKDVKLFGEDGKQLRHLLMTIDNKGNVTKISREFTDKGKTETADIDQTYDKYGNITGIKYPENINKQRVEVVFEYDNDVHQFVIKRTDQEGYEFHSEYDTKWGVCTSHTDDNKTQIKYEYDNRCRLTKVLGPKESAAGADYTMRYSYGQADDHAYSMTEYYRDDYPSDPLRTVIFVDGNGRILCTKKDISVFTTPETADERKMSVTGKIIYDRFGNVTEVYLPSSELLGKETTLPDITSSYPPIKTAYDVLDRKIRVTMPDGTESKMEYALSDEGNKILSEITQIDALGRKTKRYIDMLGQTYKTVKYNNEEEITTSFEYNSVGEILKVIDTDGNETDYTYDELGRKLSVDNPDVGLVTYEYDKTGNLLSKQTANLHTINKDFKITYKYDYNRLVEINYPHNPWNKVEYTYGKRGDEHFRGGRLYLIQDASGGTEFFFDEMGNVTKNIRTVLISQNNMRTFVSESEFDTWGRTRKLVYPDGEIVDFAYNHAGNLTSMKGTKSSREYPIILRQGYDERENRIYRKYGNGTEQSLDYEPLRNRLINSDVSFNGNKYLDNAYSYDNVGNIVSIVNSANIPDFGLGGNYRHSYRYDDLDRLISAEGDAETRDEKHSYTLSMKYDNRYSIMNKVQTHKSISKTDGETTVGEHHLSYQYDGDTPSAPSRIGSRLYLYDANGNPTSWVDTASGDFRQMIWDEENRMSAISVNGEDLCFTYDHAGERVVKSSSTNDMLFVNGKFMGSVQHGEDFTAYVSPMFTYAKDRFTKHYYVGGERVSSRIGSGQFTNKFDQATNPVITAGNQNYVLRMAQLNSESTSELARRYDLPPGPATNKGIYEKLLLEGKLEVTENPNYVAPEETNYDIPRGWPKYPVFPDSGDVPGPPIQFEEMTPDSVRAGYTFTDPNMMGEVDEYFYHGDHLSSVVLVTDRRASIVQQFTYMPYGELLVDESTVDLDFRFSAKETDRETGLSYFGARCYDPTVAVWLGADPLWEVYAGMNPYNYCAGNPVGLMDVDGRKIEEGSKQEWEKNRNLVNKKIQSIQKNIEEYKNKAVEKGWTQEKLDKKTSELKSRLNWLNEKNQQLDKIESSSQVYRLKKIKDVENPRGEVSLNPTDKVIEIAYFSTSNFVHETTHAWQFEEGHIAFASTDGMTVFLDVWDEVLAYTMEYAYSGERSLASIGSDFVRNVRYDGDKIYAKLPNHHINADTPVWYYEYVHRKNYGVGIMDNRPVKEFFEGTYAK